MLSSALLPAFLLYTHLLSVLDVGKSGLQSSVQYYSGASVGFFLLVLAVEVIHDKLSLLAESSDVLIV